MHINFVIVQLMMQGFRPPIACFTRNSLNTQKCFFPRYIENSRLEIRGKQKLTLCGQHHFLQCVFENVGFQTILTSYLTHKIFMCVGISKLQ